MTRDHLAAPAAFANLMAAAREVLKNSYAPYSEFHVGAAVLGNDGRCFVGTNIENASYGLTICAERAAVFAAVTAGCNRVSVIAIATDTTDDATVAAPCGACLQVLAEFMSNDGVVILNDGSQHKFQDFFPRPFRLRPV